MDYASVWAGAHVRPIPASSPQLIQEAQWLKSTCAKFDSLSKEDPGAGITRVKGIELFEAPNNEYTAQTAEKFFSESGLRGYRDLKASELPTSVTKGYEYDTYCINALVYCQYLLRLFILQKGKTMSRHLKSEREAFSLAEVVPLVVNATGTGFHDQKVFPTRGTSTFSAHDHEDDTNCVLGQTVLTDFVQASKTVTRQNGDGSWNFVIPRFFAGGTIIGGTKEPGNWDPEPHTCIRQSLLENGANLLNFAKTDESNVSLQDLHVIQDIVGRRPTREGGVRVELETVALVQTNHGDQRAFILHAYGAGGRGFELSWGIAEDVANLASCVLFEDVRSKL